MEKLYLFNNPTQSFKEKNLIFKTPETAPAAPDKPKKEAVADKPAAAPDKPKGTVAEGGKEEPKKEKEVTKGDLSARVKALKDKVEEVAEDDEHTEILKKSAKEIAAALGKIETEIGKLKDDVSEDDLKKFEEKLKEYEEGDKSLNKKFDEATLNADKKNKEYLDTARTDLEDKKKDADPKAICEKVKEKVKKPDDIVKGSNLDKIYDAILARFKDEKTFKLDGSFKAIEAKLAKAEKEQDAKKAKDLIEEARADIEKIEPDKIASSYVDIISNFTQLLSKSGDGKYGKAEASKVTGEFAKWVKSEPDENAINETEIQEKFVERVVIAKACDIISSKELDVSPEALQKAISTYDLGQYEKSHVNKDDKRDKILKALIKNEEDLKENGVNFKITAGTDGTKWKENSDVRNDDWHDKTKAALEKLLALNKNSKLEIKDGSGNDIVLDDTTKQFITDYNGKASGDREAFAQANKAAFLNAGGIFDLALNIQRAQEMKERLYGKYDKDGKLENADDVKMADSEYLNITLGSKDNHRPERRSGLAFYYVVDDNKEKADDEKTDTEEKKPDPAPPPADPTPGTRQSEVQREPAKPDPVPKKPDPVDPPKDPTSPQQDAPPVPRATDSTVTPVPGTTNDQKPVKDEKKATPAAPAAPAAKPPAGPIGGPIYTPATPAAKPASAPAAPDAAKAAASTPIGQPGSAPAPAPDAAKPAAKPEDNPPPEPQQKDFKDKATYETAWEKYKKEVWEPWAAKQIESNKDKVAKFETPSNEDKKFDTKVKEQVKSLKAFIGSKGVAIVDISATDCVPCKWIKPLVYQLAGQGLSHESEQVRFANFNQNSLEDGRYSELKKFHETYGIKSFPTLLVFKDSKLVIRTGGGVDNKSALEKRIKGLLDISDKYPNGVIDGTYTNLLEQIKTGKVQKSVPGEVYNFSLRTDLEKMQEWKTVYPAELGFEKCDTGLGAIRYKDTTGKYLYFGPIGGRYFQIEAGEKPQNDEAQKAKIKSKLADLRYEPHFSKMKEPVYNPVTNIWTVEFEYSEASKKAAQQEVIKRKVSLDSAYSSAHEVLRNFYSSRGPGENGNFYADGNKFYFRAEQLK